MENQLIYSDTIIYSNELIDVKVRKYFEYKIVKENSKDKISNDVELTNILKLQNINIELDERLIILNKYIILLFNDVEFNDLNNPIESIYNVRMVNGNLNMTVVKKHKDPIIISVEDTKVTHIKDIPFSNETIYSSGISQEIWDGLKKEAETFGHAYGKVIFRRLGSKPIHYYEYFKEGYNYYIKQKIEKYKNIVPDVKEKIKKFDFKNDSDK